MFRSKFYIVISVLVILALVVGGCAEPSPTQATTGTLKVYVTDARSREEISKIMVTVSEVQVHKALAEQEQEQQQAKEGQGEWISITIDDTAKTFNLLDIEGIEQYLGQVDVLAVKYTQVRLVVDAVQVEFDNSGELEDARIPSKELKIVHPFNIVKGETTALVIDFDADRMVTITGSGDIIVKPVVKLTNKQEKPQGQNNGTKQEISLEDTVWVLQSYGAPGNLKDIITGTEITAEFVSSEGTVKGSAGCNSYFGSYEIEGSQLLIPGPIGATEMYCAEPEGVMDQEQEYLAALQLSENYEINDDELTVHCGNQVLIFKFD
jgi:heat shock protein HslJ